MGPRINGYAKGSAMIDWLAAPTTDWMAEQMAELEFIVDWEGLYNQYWVTRDGKRILVSQLTLEHTTNILKLYESKAGLPPIKILDHYEALTGTEWEPA